MDWGTDGGPLLDRFTTASAPTEKRTLSRLLSSLTSLMALRGWLSLNEAWEGLPSLLDDHVFNHCMFEGIHPDSYIEEQVRLKARRFNLFLNRQGDDELDRIAEEYRRQARGG